MKISGVIITHNEEDRIEGALLSCREVCDEIVVIDSHSSDRTRDLALRYGARVILKEFEDYGRQKNFAASQAEFDWILNIDADERVSPELSRSISSLKRLGPGTSSGFRICIRTWYLGQWIRFSGWHPDPKIRVFDRRKGHWVGRIHEHLEVEGELGDLEGNILHYTYRDIGDHIALMNRYSTIMAQDLAESSKNGLLFRAFFSSPANFWGHWLLKGGILDGRAGFIISAISSWGAALKYFKAWEIRKNHQNHARSSR